MRSSLLIFTFITSAALLAGCTSSIGGQSGAQSSPGQSTADAASSSADSSASQSDEGGNPSQPDLTPQETSLPPIKGGEWSHFISPIKPHTTDKPMVFHEMRIGEHDDFYRVVVEFTGKGSPGLFQEWAKVPTEQGRGEPLPVEGNAHLDLILTGTSMPLDDAANKAYYKGPRTISHGPVSVREDGTFEDTTHIVISMDAERDIQIGFLDSPVRAVIDIKK